MYSGSTFPPFLSGTFWPIPPPYNYLSLLALVLFCPILFNQGHLVWTSHRMLVAPAVGIHSHASFSLPESVGCQQIHSM